MNEPRARELLALLDERVLMWRGPALTGADVDLLVPARRRQEVEGIIAGAGLELRDDGHWATPEGDVLLDLVDEDGWPGSYPDFEEVRARADRAPSPPVAAAEDRLLIFAAEAIAGRPLAKLVPKLRELARSAPEAAARAARADAPLARLGGNPRALAAAERRGTLSYPRALAAGLRSPRGRAALRMRFAATAERRFKKGGRRPRPPAA